MTTLQNRKISGKRVNENSELCGKGFDAGEISFTGWNEKSFGLFSLKERLKSLGGHTDIRSKEGQGTRVTLIIPVEAFENKGA